ncbi:hypothetical protein [uncultured Maribacter sp.]|uniref:hypothetical protein n=1 Tax=uncultured Maribacter sp. TaxID=431308 RepID=UPI0026215B16|nr:hypothetical protein [uncultured Maribacter sp.]
MNKTLTLVLIALAIALISYNVTLLDFNNLFEGNSIIALIGIMASLVAIVLILVFNTSKKIQKKMNEN